MDVSIGKELPMTVVTIIAVSVRSSSTLSLAVAPCSRQRWQKGNTHIQLGTKHSHLLDNNRQNSRQPTASS